MKLLANLWRHVSWKLALFFAAAGAGGAALLQLGQSDFDRSGFVRSREGLRLAYEVEGQGFPLVALAGGPGISHHGFHPYLGLLRGSATLIYFDPRGRGESDAAPTYRVADDVSDLESLRAGLGLHRIDLLGVSYGAHLGVSYAVEHPEAVRKLVLVSPIVGRSAWRAHLSALTEAPGMEETLASIREAGREVRLSNHASLERVARRLLPLYWCDPAAGRRAGSVFRAWHRVARQNMDVYEAIVGQPFPELNGDLARSRIEERLGEILAPALVLQGECDRVAPADQVRALETALPAGKLVTVPAGHSPFAERPGVFAERVKEFLREPLPLPAAVRL